jgi:hypothetical protein
MGKIQVESNKDDDKLSEIPLTAENDIMMIDLDGEPKNMIKHSKHQPMQQQPAHSQQLGKFKRKYAGHVDSLNLDDSTW